MRSAVRALIAATAVLAAACSSSSEPGGGTGPIPLAQFCAQLVDGGCAYGARCGGVPANPAQCRAELAKEWDECPFMQQAVEQGESDYDAAAARQLVEATRVRSCDLSPALDPVNAFPVFKPKRQSGQTCRSKVSCVAGLACNGHTVSTPDGVCSPLP